MKTKTWLEMVISIAICTVMAITTSAQTYYIDEYIYTTGDGIGDTSERLYESANFNLLHKKNEGNVIPLTSAELRMLPYHSMEIYPKEAGKKIVSVEIVTTGNHYAKALAESTSFFAGASTETAEELNAADIASWDGLDATITLADKDCEYLKITIIENVPARTTLWKITYTTDYDTPTITIPANTLNLTASPLTPAMKEIPIGGANLTEDITVSGVSTPFSIQPTSLPASGGTLTVTYAPSAPGTHTQTLTLSSQGAITKIITLNGTANEPAIPEFFIKRTHANAYTPNPMPYRLFIPQNYDPQQSYPLVLFMHGAGERGEDNVKPLEASSGAQLWARPENQAKYPCFIVVPQCRAGKQWVDVPTFRTDRYSIDELPASMEMQAVVDLLDALQEEFNIDASKLYVTGYSMGGYATWDLILRHPHLFAAAIPICGSGDPTKAPLIGHLPLRIFHGADDTTVPPDGSRNMVNAINALGKSDREADYYTEYPQTGHGSWEKAYAEENLVDWLFNAQPVHLTQTTHQAMPVKPTTQVYVNDGTVTIQHDFANNQVTHVSVFDIRGMVLHTLAHQDTNALAIELPHPGVFLIHISTPEQQEVFKIVI